MSGKRKQKGGVDPWWTKGWILEEDEHGDVRRKDATINDICATLNKLASFGCTIDEAAGYLTEYLHLPDLISHQYVIHLFNKVPKARIAWETGRSKVKVSLRRRQIQKALEGDNTMLIWLGKNMLKQSDRVSNELSGPDGGPITINTESAIDVIMERLAGIEKRMRDDDGGENT